jgi:hypothetical protein
MIPFLLKAMHYATTPEVSRLTGLSTETLREWTSRRALIEADVRPKSKGSPARYTWQTILVLRVAVTLRERFHVELQAHKPLFDSIRAAIRHASVRDLWGKNLALQPDSGWTLVEGQTLSSVGDAIILRLDPHLEILLAGLHWLDTPAKPVQIEMFPADEAIAGTAAQAMRVRRQPVVEALQFKDRVPA